MSRMVWDQMVGMCKMMLVGRVKQIVWKILDLAADFFVLKGSLGNWAHSTI